MKLYIRGCFDGIHGYGAHIRSHLRLLDKEKLPYRLLYVPLDPNTLETPETDRWKEKIALSPEPGSIIVNFLEACYYEFFPNCYHIGYTQWEVLGLPSYPETINPDLAWVERMNRCQQIWTGSSFAKRVFLEAGVKTPITVLPWVIDLKQLEAHSALPTALTTCRIPTWKAGPNLHLKLRPFFRALSQFPKNFRLPLISLGYFLFEVLGHIQKWVAGARIERSRTKYSDSSECVTFICTNTFNERKNLRDLIAAFLFSFSKDDKVQLVLRTYHAIDSRWMRIKIISEINTWVAAMKIENAPPVFVITDTLSESEYRHLLQTAKFFVNTSKGEGVGGGVLQSMSYGIPAITHLFSSFADFCNSDNSIIYEASLEPVVWNFNFYGFRQQWARPNMDSLSKEFRRAYQIAQDHPAKYDDLSRKAKESACAYGNPERVAVEYRKLLLEPTRSK